MTVARKPEDEKVEVTIEQLRDLLEVLVAGNVDDAKRWLVAAIHQGKKDIRERSHK